LLKATAAEEEAALKKAQEVLAKINAGESFEDLAKQFSDDVGSKKKGGDLGWFGAGMMVKPFEEAIKAMKVGEVSTPVKSQYGFHIIELLDVKPEVVRSFAEVRTQLEKELQKEDTEAKFEGQAEQFGNLAFENPNSLEVLTETLNLENKSTGLFDRTGGDQKDQHPVLSESQVIEAAFSDDVLEGGYNSEPIEIGEQHAVILRLKDHKQAKAKPLNEVRQEIVTAITRDKTRAEAQSLGKTLLDQIKQTGDSKPVESTDLNWSPAQWIKRKDTTLKQPVIVREAFKIGQPSENTAIYQGFELDNGDYALVTVLDVKDGVVPPPATEKSTTDDNQQDEPRQKAEQQQQQALGTSEFGQLVSGLKADAEIKDYSKKLSDS